jgi:hypothetical protein
VKIFAQNTALVVLLVASAAGRAEVADTGNDPGTTSPYISPQRDCLSEGLINPPGKEYRYLFSKDCRVVFVLPPANASEDIISSGLNLEGCGAVAENRKNIQAQEQTITEMQVAIGKLEAKLAQNYSRDLEGQIARLQERIQGYSANRLQAVKDFQTAYGKTPGASFAIRLNDSISQADLNGIRALNLASLNRIVNKEIHQPGPDGKDQVVKYQETIVSSLRPAPLDLSVISFHYTTQGNMIDGDSLVFSDISGLEHLEQPGSKTGAVSVRSNGAVTGKVLLSLPWACSYAKPDATGRLQLNSSDADPLFVANHTFSVQEMFGQGYLARLKVDKVVNQIVDRVDTDTQHGFQKSVTFESDIGAHVNELLDFKWVSEHDGDNNVSLAQTLELQKAVATKLIDDYIEKLVAQKILTPQEDPVVDPAKGGNSTETGVASRCWTESDGGLSGMFGGRHTVCGDYTYTYQVWHDGITREDIRKSLLLDGETTESMSINQMTPFYFTTAFSTIKE